LAMRLPIHSLIVFVVIITYSSLAFFPRPATAAFLPSESLMDLGNPEIDRHASLQKIQSVLESKVVAQRLSDFGLTKEEIQSRLGQMSDRQLHEVATQLDALQPGGDALGTIVVLLVIAILVVVLLQLTGHKIIITK